MCEPTNGLLNTPEVEEMSSADLFIRLKVLTGPLKCSRGRRSFHMQEQGRCPNAQILLVRTNHEHHPVLTDQLVYLGHFEHTRQILLSIQALHIGRPSHALALPSAEAATDPGIPIKAP